MRPECSIVSLYPFDIRIENDAVFPSIFDIPKGHVELGGKNATPAVLLLGDGQIQHYLDVSRGNIMMGYPAEKIASSLVRDYLESVLYTDKDAHPAIFWLDEPFNPEKHVEFAREAVLKQENFYRKLIRIADAAWAESQNPMLITDTQKVAASYFGEKKDWALEPGEDTKMCTTCGITLRSFAVICPGCGFILKPRTFEKIKHRFYRPNNAETIQ